MSIAHLGLAQLENDFGKLIVGSDEMLEGMLKAAADVMIDETKEKAEAMLQGEYYKGDIKKSTRMGKIRKNANGKYTSVIFYGTVVDKKHPRGERIARIAYINEYGKRSQPARPFVRMAVLDGTRGALDAASEVLGDYLSKNNL